MSVSLQADKDTYLYQYSLAANGTSTVLYTYPWAPGFSKRGLLSFDLSAVSGSIVSAYVVLSEVSSYGYSRTLNFHRVTTSWSEASANWITPWTSSGGDYAAAVSGTLAALSPGINKDSVNVTADVQSFVSCLTTNYGWLFKDNTEDNSQQWWAFGSRENANTDDRPVLRISYIPGPLCWVLPVTLTEFSLACVSGLANLRWETHSEKNSQYYELEKSTDMQNWNAITQIQPENSHGPASYKYTDPDVSDKTMYYRLKMVDTDGSYVYSGTISNGGCTASGSEVRIYSVPGSGKLFFESPSVISQVRATDCTGRCLSLPVEDNSIDVSVLANGFYVLCFTSANGGSFVRKISRP